MVAIMTNTLFASDNGKLLNIGSKAPEFTLVASNGDTVRLSDFTEKNNVVLVFYPGDETPGCTRQLCAIRNDYEKFEAKDTKVFGVNPANIDSHKKFVKSQGYQFSLLVDERLNTAKKYGCDGWPMLKRTVYAIDKHGKIVFAQRGMPTDDEILKAIPDGK